MIVAKLMGGLGNQMFQYAFGKALALKHNVKLKLDISALTDQEDGSNNTIRDFSLKAFNIHADLASEQEIQEFKKNKIGKIVDLASLSLPLRSSRLYVREPHFHFFENALKAPENSYIDGYWQSEKYFNSIRKQLLEEFSPVKPISTQSKSIADKIKSTTSVSIHVRRGDYISVPQNSDLYEVCSETYYKEAINIIANKVENPVFYVFSNEPEWFENNIKIDFPVEFVRHNTGNNSFEDMYLMSLCQHNIIANSSFSWWGAWLNQHPDKLVLAPKKWFKNNLKNTKDLLPQAWIQL